MPADGVGWYAHIHEAMEDLQAQLKRMELAKATPEQFGLAVRSHPETLIVTARNKLGTGREFPMKVGLAENLIETTRIVLDAKQLEKNMVAGEALVRSVVKRGAPAEVRSRGYLFRNVDVDTIMDLLRSYRADPSSPPVNPLTDPKLIGDYIGARQDSELKLWDVFLANSTRKEFAPVPFSGLSIGPYELSVDQTDLGRGVYSFSGASRRFGSAEDESKGLEPEQVAQAHETFRLSRADQKLPKTVNPSFYRRVPGRRPLLIVRLVKPKVGENDGVAQHAPEVLAWGLSFPSSAIGGGTVEYVVNTIRMREMFGEEEIEEEALGDTE